MINFKSKTKSTLPGCVDRALASGIWVQLAWFTTLICVILITLSSVMLLTYQGHETILLKDASPHTQQWLAQTPEIHITDTGELILIDEARCAPPATLEAAGIRATADGKLRLNEQLTPANRLWLAQASDIKISEQGTLYLTNTSTQNWRDKLRGVFFHFLDPGNLYMEQYQGGWTLFFSSVTSLLGMVFFSGLLISTMSNIIERRVHDVKRGLITYKGMKNHYVIIGYGEITMSLLDDIFFNRGENMKQEVRSFRQLTRANSSKLAKNIPTVLILSKQDIPTIRAEIYSFLPPQL